MVMDCCIHNSLYDFQVNNMICSQQSRFLKHYGTEAALMKIVDEHLANLNNNRGSGVLLIAYCKSFDMVDHNLLLLKLKAYGVNDSAYD